MFRSIGFFTSLGGVLAVAGLCAGDPANANQQAKSPPVQPPPTQGKTAPPAQAIAGQQSFNNGTVSPVPWFLEPGVQKQLNLKPEQASKLNQAYSNAWNRFKTDNENLAKMNESQRTDKSKEYWGNFNSQMLQTAQGNLTPEQFNRYRQLYYQHSGLGTVIDPTVQEKLDFTPDQQQRLRDYAAKHQEQINSLFKGYPGNANAMSQQYEEMRRQNYQFFNDLLTERQRQEWRNLTGDPHTFAADWYFKK